ncbi:MAG TPA: hypothetical protein VKC34_11960, partial [Blastocatellia bacterium]|nr:hypothetical protein [Blastocatellia bacterium]
PVTGAAAPSGADAAAQVTQNDVQTGPRAPMSGQREAGQGQPAPSVTAVDGAFGREPVTEPTEAHLSPGQQSGDKGAEKAEVAE